MESGCRRPGNWENETNANKPISRMVRQDGYSDAGRSSQSTWGNMGRKRNKLSVFSEHATKVEVCFFDDDGAKEVDRRELPEYTNQIWHEYIRRIARARVMGFVSTAHMNPTGHRFNPNKLLLDPYACEIAGELKWNPAVFGYQMETGDDLTSTNATARRSCPSVSWSIRSFDWQWSNAKFAESPGTDTIVYESHVKGFTKLHPAVDEKLRGTYAGLGSKRCRRLHHVSRRHDVRTDAHPHLRR